MCKTVAYMRISTKEERGKQRFTRQEQAIERYCKENNVEIPERRIYKDDASGKSFDRKSWKELENDIQTGDTIVFKDICRFTREYENGFAKYMELLNKGINFVFIDNPTISTDYINSMMCVAEKMEDRIAKNSLEHTIQLLILVELDRAEKEREITVKRIKDGIASSDKKSGRPVGKLDKMSEELKADLLEYKKDRSITVSSLMKKHGISRNTIKKYLNVIENENNQIKDYSIEEVFSEHTRAKVILRNNGIHTLKELCELNEEQLDNMRNLGRYAKETILNKLKEYGMSLRA